LEEPGIAASPPFRGGGLSVGVFAIADTYDFYGVVTLLAIDEAPCANAEAEQGWIKSFELLDVAGLGLEETIEGFEEPEGLVAIDGANIDAGFEGPENAFSH